MADAARLLPLRCAAGRWVVLAAVLGSGMALLDSTVVNVAVRPIGVDLGATLSELQWVVNAYMLSLASLILVGGSLGDRLGRRRVFVVGVVWFALASIACGFAQDASQLITARALQGIGAALLTPGSLALIQATLVPADRARAIGIWSAWTGVAAAVGPLLGGALIQAASWRWVFLINVPLAAVIVAVTLRHVPESRTRAAASRFDLPGAVLGAVALGGVTFALIEGGWAPLVVGVGGIAAFLLRERLTRHPMLPLGLFAERTFSTANVVTLVVYGALGALMFLLILQLQVVSGFSPLQSGLAMVPFTVLMLLFSSRSGALATRIGPRLQMTVGPLVSAAGVLLLRRVSADASYLVDVLPGVLLFGVGMTLLVAPLTASVLAAVDDDHAGLASGVNNAVARAASLLAVAALPTLVGLSGDDYRLPAVLDSGYEDAMLWCAGLLTAGALVSVVLLPRGVGLQRDPELVE
ncbi:MAG TPA: MFS transporter [Nocardioidaceae bacterium]|nr:MFS transporter [Nocardioidaceae bacterium]